MCAVNRDRREPAHTHLGCMLLEHSRALEDPHADDIGSGGEALDLGARALRVELDTQVRRSEACDGGTDEAHDGR